MMYKLWGIRHVRFFYLRFRFNWWWETCGRYLGAVPNQQDIDYLENVWKGLK